MKYLIEIHHGIGDMVQMMGVVDSILSVDNSAKIFLIINNKSFADLISNDERINGIFFLNLKKMSKFMILKQVIKMRREKFDYFFISPISNVKYSRLLANLINSKNSYGVQLRNKKKMCFVDKVDSHIVEMNFKLVQSAFCNANFCIPKLHINVGQKNSIGFNKFVCLCIGTSIPQKQWDVSNYIYVGKKLEEFGYKIILLGGKKEEDEVRNLDIPVSFVNYLGKTTLKESAEILKEASLVIGGDTGVLHIAAALEVPTLCLFSCTDPFYHFPYSFDSYVYYNKMDCQFCYEKGLVSMCTDYKCIKTIDKDAVLDLSIKILNGSCPELKQIKEK